MTEEKFIFDRIADALEKIVDLLGTIAHNQLDTVATPAISCSNSVVTITCATAGAVIHYTDDGSVPTKNSPVYSGTISITEAKTFKAIAVKIDMNNSEVASMECQPTVATPTISCTSNTVTIASATEGAAIHYTTDGSAPTAESDTYSEPIDISETTTFKAIAIKEGMVNSAVASQECEYVAP